MYMGDSSNKQPTKGINFSDNLVIGMSLPTLLVLISLISGAIFGYVDLKKEIDVAKGLPTPGTGAYTRDLNDETARYTWPVTYMEYHLKDETIRETIAELQQKIEELEAEVIELKTNGN